MKLCAFLLFAFAFASAQTTPAVGPTMTIDWPTATLPDVTIGIGPSWTRGDAHAHSVDVNGGFRIKDSNWFSWSTVSTPVASVAPGAPPLASTITTGGAWIAARNTAGSISLVTLFQGGFSAVQATGSIAPAFTGSLGVAFRWRKSNVYVFPYARAANPTTGSNGALATAIFQPGVMLIYGFSRSK